MVLEVTAGKILATYLEAEDVAGWPDAKQPWTVTYDSMPSEEDPKREWITVRGTTARRDFRDMRAGVAEFPGVSVFVRGRTDDAVQIKAEEIATLLDTVYDALVAVEVGEEEQTYRIHQFSRRSDPAFLRQDEQKRMRVYVFTGFLTIWKEG